MFTMEKHEVEPDEKKMLLSHVRAGAGRTRFLVDMAVRVTARSPRNAS